MSFLIQQTLLFAIPLMIVALAGVFSERSGIINLALEGIMIMGAFIGVLAVRQLQPAFEASARCTQAYNSFMNGKVGKSVVNADTWKTLENVASYMQKAKLNTQGGIDPFTVIDKNAWLSLQGMQVLCILIAAAAGAVFSLLLSFASVNLKADQTIGGTALNLLAPAISLFMIRILVNQNTMGMDNAASGATWFQIKKAYFGYKSDAKLGFLGSTFLDKTYLATYLTILVFVIMSIILYKTRFGLRLRSCGENPQAADSLGINVNRMRYAGVSISGALAGMGGFVYALTTQGCTTNGDVAGFGFLALAVMIFGNWKPLNIAGGALLFGLFKCIAASYSTLDINGDGKFLLNSIGVSSYIYRLLPYVITLVVLALTSKNSRAPKAEGIPYDKGKR